ncbi:MAG TPA: DUF3794 domain-containing protein [Methylomusa anaerophila]|uniref:Bacterial SH3 domain protein n=1 Tax=Methylomusa anaerophila TaxID=1930071 RepID=A0A348AGW6_9FIRM|nr:SPOCS domain-containing protein [Methylomusa anaerophila]BBB90314.1 bacterial SH3 domain protein [Methylomusa anaerophila]HML89340.1 DUF3794 domain-containing protein [Methylomusa anaerophila]
MDDELRQSSGSTTTSGSTTISTTGSKTSDQAEAIYGCPEPGMETIEVEQVLGADMEQRVLELDLFVPSQKPDIEQVLDVYVKDVEITSVDVIPDKVIIRGELEVKIMYVADLPNQPVHAFEKSHIRFTRDIEILGAEANMKTTSDVTVEFVDYDFDENDPRKVHVTIVLKIWARVVNTVEMDVYALGPIDEVGTAETTSATASASDSASASTLGDTVSASTGGGGLAGYDQNIVTGPMTPTAGVPVSGPSGETTITGNVVNIRTGPGTNFPIVTKVNQGDTVVIRDQAFGWYNVVLYDGTTGWVASWLVSGPGVPESPKG